MRVSAGVGGIEDPADGEVDGEGGVVGCVGVCEVPAVVDAGDPVDDEGAGPAAGRGGGDGPACDAAAG